MNPNGLFDALMCIHSGESLHGRDANYKVNPSRFILFSPSVTGNIKMKSEKALFSREDGFQGGDAFLKTRQLRGRQRLSRGEGLFQKIYGFPVFQESKIYVGAGRKPRAAHVPNGLPLFY